MHKIILDTDPGIDDAQAIAFALAHPEIELLGLTTIFGNAEIDITTNNALTILNVMGAELVPVFKGADKPLQIDRFPAPDFVHGADGLGNVKDQLFSDLSEVKAHSSQSTAAEWIVAMANESPKEITLVAIGPLTNLAEAILLDPDLPSKVKQVVVMGGVHKAKGNVSPVAEANFINDPHAADIVCRQNWPLSIIGLDVTMEIALTESRLEELRTSAGRVGEFLWHTSQYYLDFYSSLEVLAPTERACAMHDTSALAYLVRPELFQFSTGSACVIESGPAMGQFILGDQSDNYFLSTWRNRPSCQIATQVDSEAVLELFSKTLSLFS